MRVVSLVPSLTETVAEGGGADRLVGVTDWCTHPPDVVARVPRVGGTKNPRVADVLALAPDLVVANDEENRAEDVAALRAAGVEVLVTSPRTVPDALATLAEVLAACGLDPEPGWLAAARDAWAEPVPVTRRAFVPIWRRPWMALGRDTFAGDLLARLGVGNVYADAADRYPRVDLADARARRPDLVVLPDEPYAFSAADLDAFEGWAVPVRFVSGRHLTWYGPSLAEARYEVWTQVS